MSTLSTVKCVHIIFWKCTKNRSMIWVFIRWNNMMGRNSLVNTGIQTFLSHGNKLLFAKNDSLPWTKHDKTAKRYAGWSRLRYGTCISSLTVISLCSSVKCLFNYYSMEWGLLLPCMIKSSLPLRIFFAKVLSVLPNGKPGTANPPQTSWVYLLFLHLPYCILCRQAQRRHVLYGQESREDGNECSQPLRLKEQLAPLVVKYCFSL